LKFKIVENKELNKDIDKEKLIKNEAINFLKENQFNIKNIKIIDKDKKDIPKEEKDEKLQKLSNLISEEDVENLINNNKINEDHYNQMLYLNNLSKFIKQGIQDDIDEDNNNNLEKINEESIQMEDESIKFNEIKLNIQNNKKSCNDINKDVNKEDKEIVELKNKIIQEIGNDLFNLVYKYIDDYTDKTEIKFNSELLAEKLSKEFINKKYDKNKLNLVIQKLPEIFVIVVQNRLNSG